jgi:hydroxyacylglutathione hydrolase
MSVHELHTTLETAPETQQILDVRREDEWRQGHIRGACHIPAQALISQLDEVDRSLPVAVYCYTGYRAGIAASLLKRSGCGAVFNVPGSMSAWMGAAYPVEAGERE